jgi:hypothetical protein
MNIITRIAGLPAGWRIERQDDPTQIIFEIFEPKGTTWPNGSPRAALAVTIYKPGPFREEAEVSWPSTSDNRAILAQAVAVAIGLAAEEADAMNATSDPSQMEFEIAYVNSRKKSRTVTGEHFAKSAAFHAVLQLKVGEDAPKRYHTAGFKRIRRVR